jgi:hypothetical protein
VPAAAPHGEAGDVIDLNPASAQKRAGGHRRTSLGSAAAPALDKGRRLTIQHQNQQLGPLVEEQEERQQHSQQQQVAAVRRASLVAPVQAGQAEQPSEQQGLSKGMQQLVQVVQATTASMAAAVSQQPQAMLQLPSEDAGPVLGPAHHSPQLSIQGSTSCVEGGGQPGISPDAAAQPPLGAPAAGAAPGAAGRAPLGWPAKTPGRPLGQAPPTGSVPSMTPRYAARHS